MNQECGKRIFLSSDSAQNSMEFWDYTVELECMKGQDDLQLAAELGKRLLERNRELESIIRSQQLTLDDQALQLEHFSKQASDARELAESRLRACEQLELSVAELERSNQGLRKELREEKHRTRSLSETVSSLETPAEEAAQRWDLDLPRLTPPPVTRRRRSEPPWKIARQLRLERQPSKEFVNAMTMTDDLFDDERSEVEVLEASFLRELDRRLGNSEAEIERLQEEIGLLLVRLADSEGRVRDVAEERAELELKVEDLTKLLSALTTPSDPRRLDDAVFHDSERGNEMSLEEEFRISGDFDDVSSGIQSDIDTSLTTRDVTPEFDERKVTAWNPTNDNIRSRYFSSNFLLSQGDTEEEPLSILFSPLPSDCVSCYQSTRTQPRYGDNLRSELEKQEIIAKEKFEVLKKQEVIARENETRANGEKKDQTRTENPPVRLQDEVNEKLCGKQNKNVQNKFKVEGKAEREKVCEVDEQKVPSGNQSKEKQRNLSECNENDAKSANCQGKKNRKRRKRICNGVFHNPKPTPEVPFETPVDTQPSSSALSAISRPFRDLLGVCKVVGSFALCYIVNSCLEFGHSDQNPIGDLSPPLLLLNDSFVIVGQ